MTGLGERNRLIGIVEIRATDPIDRRGTHFRIAVVEFGVQVSQKFSISPRISAKPELRPGKPF